MASGNDKFMYFLLGSFVGASVALLITHKSGEDVLKFLEDRYRGKTDLLSKKAREGGEYVAKKSQEVADQVTEGIDRSKDTLNRQRDQVVAAIEAGKKAYKEEKQKLESPQSFDS